MLKQDGMLYAIKTFLTVLMVLLQYILLNTMIILGNPSYILLHSKLHSSLVWKVTSHPVRISSFWIDTKMVKIGEKNV